MKPDFQIGIVGAGFAGVIAALRLKQTGRDSFVIFEKAKEVGGTWRDNVYPGCACDVPSNLYSISFEPNPNWQRMYSSQREILDYLKNVVRKNNLEERISYDSEILKYQFDEQFGWWKLTDRNGVTTVVRTVIIAMGPFNRPQMPKIKGIETFAGKALHSARWDESYVLKNKRVAVIGTGASAVQIVPAIAPEVAQLTVFQRSAAWIGTRMDAEISAEKRRRYGKYPFIQKFWRGFLYWLLELRGRMFIGNQTIYKYFRKLSLQKIENEVEDPETRRKLTPDYKLGCKRILSSDDYLPTFNRENVALETDSISEINRDGIVTTNGVQHDFDTIIFATGFEVADITTEMRIYGRNGKELFDEWQTKGLEAYKGMMISGYPNLAFILGPNTGLGHSSMIYMMEKQVDYIIKYLTMLEKKPENGFLDLKPEVQESYNRTIHEQFQNTLWASGCKSWYINAAGRNTTLYPRLTWHFRRRTKRIDGSEYDFVNQSES